MGTGEALSRLGSGALKNPWVLEIESKYGTAADRICPLQSLGGKSQLSDLWLQEPTSLSSHYCLGSPAINTSR